MRKPNDRRRPNPQTPALGRLFQQRGVLIHESAAVSMIPHPMNPMGARVVPWIEKPGHTYNVGRNVDKRRLRQGPRKCWRVLQKA